MIKIEQSKNEFEYEIRSLIKAFFPTEKVVFKQNNIFSEHNIGQEIEPNKISKREKFKVLEYEKIESVILINITYNIDSIRICLKINTEDELIRIGSADANNRKEYKNSLKKLLYYLLTDLSGTKLEWGTLTGIRPTKIPMDKINQGKSEIEIKEYMREQYLCSDQKIDISIEIAKRELNLLEKIDYKHGYSVYIGIPFCPSTCSYCSFTSYSIEKYADSVEMYLRALYQEIDFVSNFYQNKKLTTLYIGGGTPTTLSAIELEQLLIKINSSFNVEYIKELTVEAGRPDSITYDKLKVLKDQGVTRISINPQTMKQETLDLIGRRHTTTQIQETYAMARDLGHDNINMDIILGLPGETTKDVAHTLDCIKTMDPDSLTVHTLAIKRAANLNINKEQYSDFKKANVKEMHTLTMEFARGHNYSPYYLYRQKNMTDNLENIGYSKLDKEGLYNILIMEELQTIIALGAGASSKIVFPDRKEIKRIENVKSIKDYVDRIDEMIDRKKVYY